MKLYLLLDFLFCLECKILYFPCLISKYYFLYLFIRLNDTKLYLFYLLRESSIFNGSFLHQYKVLDTPGKNLNPEYMTTVFQNSTLHFYIRFKLMSYDNMNTKVRSLIAIEILRKVLEFQN